MSLSLTSILQKASTFINRITTWDRATVSQYVVNIKTEIAAELTEIESWVGYVLGWLTNDGPTLVSEADALIAVLSPLSGASAIVKLIQAALPAFEEIVGIARTVMNTPQNASAAQSALDPFGGAHGVSLEGHKRRVTLEAAMAQGHQFIAAMQVKAAA